jgi:hypothetical protein
VTAFRKGDHVVSPGTPPLYGIVERVSDNGWELEINYVNDAGNVTGVDYWPASETRLNIECTTCGKLATHVYAVYHVANGDISSINGLGMWSPACPDCDEPELIEPEPGVFRITGPLELWRPHADAAKNAR